MTDSENYLRQLHTQLLAHFDREEIDQVCFYMGLVYDDLRGETRPAKVYNLLLLLARQSRLSQFLAIVREERPLIEWPDVPSNFQPPAPRNHAASPGATFQIGNIEAGSVNVGGIQHIEHLEVTMGIGTADSVSSAPAHIPAELAALIAGLQQALAQAPPDYIDDSQKVAKRLEVLTAEMNKPAADKELLQMYVRSLARSAAKLEETMPQVAATTNKMIGVIDNWSA